VVVPRLELIQEEQSEWYNGDTFEVRYVRGGEVWKVHGRRDEDINFTFGPEVA